MSHRTAQTKCKRQQNDPLHHYLYDPEDQRISSENIGKNHVGQQHLRIYERCQANLTKYLVSPNKYKFNSKEFNRFYIDELQFFKKAFKQLNRAYLLLKKQYGNCKSQLKKKQYKTHQKKQGRSPHQSLEKNGKTPENQIYHTNQRNFYLIQINKIRQQYEIKIKNIQKEKLFQQESLRNSYESIIRSLKKKEQEFLQERQVFSKQISDLKQVVTSIGVMIRDGSNNFHDAQYSCKNTAITQITNNTRYQKNNISINNSNYRQVLQISNLRIQLQNIKEQNGMLRSFINSKQFLKSQQNDEYGRYRNQQENRQRQLEAQFSEIISQKTEIQKQLRDYQNKQGNRMKQLHKKYEEVLKIKQKQIADLSNEIELLKNQFQLKQSSKEQEHEFQMRKSLIIQNSQDKKQLVLKNREENIKKSLKSSHLQSQKVQNHYKSIVFDKNKQIHDLQNQVSNRKVKQTKSNMTIQVLKKQKLDLAHQISKLDTTVQILRQQLINLKHQHNQKEQNYMCTLKKYQTERIHENDKIQITKQLQMVNKKLNTQKQALKSLQKQKKFIELESRTHIDKLQSQLCLQTQNFQQTLIQKKQMMTQLNKKIEQKQILEEKYNSLLIEFERKQGLIQNIYVEYQDKYQVLQIENCDLKSKEEIYEQQKIKNQKYQLELEQSKLKNIKLTAYIKQLENKISVEEQKFIMKQKEYKSISLQIEEEINQLKQTLLLKQQIVKDMEYSLEKQEKYQKQREVLLKRNQESEQKIIEITQKFQSLTEGRQSLVEELRTTFQQNLQQKEKQLEQLHERYTILIAQHHSEQTKINLIQQSNSKYEKVIKVYQYELKQAKQYISSLTTENQQLCENLKSMYQFFNGKCAEIKAYNENLTENSHTLSFRKVKMEELFSVTEIQTEQIQMENSSEVITAPYFSEQKIITDIKKRANQKVNETSEQRVSGKNIQFISNNQLTKSQLNSWQVKDKAQSDVYGSNMYQSKASSELQQDQNIQLNQSDIIKGSSQNKDIKQLNQIGQ